MSSNQIPPWAKALTDAVTELYVRLDDSSFNKFFKNIDTIKKDLGEVLDLPISKLGTKFISDLTNAMKAMNPLQKQALAINKNLIDTVGVEQIDAANQMGIALADLQAEILTLNKTGISNLSRSTLNLVARMKATDQNTAALVKFLGANTSVMMLNQSQAQVMASELGKFSQTFGARQDDILELAASVSQSFKIQSQLASGGAGGNLAAAFAELGATLGSKADDQIKQLSQIFGKGDLGQLIQLGISEGFQEKLMSENDPAKRMAIMQDMIKTAAAAIEARTSGLGTGKVDQAVYSQLIKSMGGENILVFKELAKSLEDARNPMGEMVDSLATFNSFTAAFSDTMNFFGQALLKFINLPWVAPVIKVFAWLAGALTAFVGAAALLVTGFLAFKVITGLLILALKAAVLKLLTVAAAMVFSMPFLIPLMIVAGVLGGAYAVWSAMSEDISEINKKTPDIKSVNSGLTGQIFSQLVNIVTSTNSNAIQRENLATQKELVRLIRQQNDRTDPNNASVTKPITRRI